MKRLARVGYNTVVWSTAPLQIGYLAWAVRHHVHPLVYLRQRWKPPEVWRANVADTRLWVHAVSVGEVLTAIPLIRRLETLWPDCAVVLTTVTPTGMRTARRFLPADRVGYLPFDFPRVVDRWLDAIRPHAIVTVETELWPNLYWRAACRSIPVGIVNARISDRAWSRYRRFRWFFREILRNVRFIGAQSETQAARWIALGAPPERVRVFGNLKFDAVIARLQNARPPEWLQRWRSGRTMVVWGSWVTSEWPILRDRIVRWADRNPHVCHLVAPRHIEVAERWVLEWRTRGLSVERRTRSPDVAHTVVVLDTIGELATCYAEAALAIVGGSFVAELGGHNPIEPAWFGVPVVIGPYHRDFQDIVDIFRAADAITIAPADALDAVLQDRLDHPEQWRSRGRRARDVVSRNRGALDRTVQALSAIVHTR